MRPGRLLAAALALLAALPAGAASPAAPPRLMALENQAFGILLLGEGGDKDWTTMLAALAKRLGTSVPVEFAAGSADLQAIQRGLDRLKSARVRKVVAVPLFPTSNSPLMDQTRFIFGVREDPSAAFFRGSGGHAGYRVVRRARTDLPVVLTQALDDGPLVVDILVSRAAALSRGPADEAVVIVGLAPASPDSGGPALGAKLGRPAPAAASDPGEEYRQMLSGLADRVRAKGGFKAARGAVLRPEALHQFEREKAESDLSKLVAELSRSSRVLVLPHAVTAGEANRVIRRALRGVFMRYSEKGLMPDERMVRWVEETARQGASLPDMRTYKDEGRPIPSARALEGGAPTRLKLNEGAR